MKLAKMTTCILLVILAACNFPSPGLQSPTPTALPASPPPQASATMPPAAPSPTPTRESMEPEEAILILEPGPGSRLTSPVHVAGIADPTFEQTLVVRIVLDDGSELTIHPLTIAADIGQRGPFEGDVYFSVDGERHALIQIYDQSARDGGIVHLASVGVILLSEGPEVIEPFDPHPEVIVIDRPEFGATIRGGVVHVEGFGLASFEGTLIIEVHDAEGNVVGSQPIIVQAPDWGFPGPFSADVSYEVVVEGPGRIVVIDPLPVFDGLGHISSVEVTLAP
jgi:predicted secreted protein